MTKEIVKVQIFKFTPDLKSSSNNAHETIHKF